MSALVVALLLAPPDPTKQTPEQKLQGTWKVISAHRRGEDVQAKEIEGLRVVFTEKKLIVKDGKRDEVVAFKLDATKKPVAIDLFPEKDRDERVLGIILIEGDTLKMCWSKGGGPRPTGFTTKKGSKEVLFVMRREKK